MALRTDAYYRNIVVDWLRRNDVMEPPVPLDDLARRLGLPVRVLRFPAWFEGAIIAEDGMPVILINGVRDEPRRRQTLGHLVGHVLLVLAGDGDGFSRRDEVGQRGADTMAAEMLLPEYLVRDQAAKWFNDHRYLARLFGVPENRMMDRLRELGIVKARSGIYWDY